MTEAIKDIFPKQAPCGFKKETGYWEIALGSPENSSVDFLNELTITMVEFYLEAFSFLCRPVEVRYDLMIFDENGELKSIQEGEVQHIESQEASDLMQGLKQIIDYPLEPFIPMLFVECDLQVFIPVTKGLENRTWVPRAGQFYVGHVMEPDDKNRLIPVESSISFNTTIDVWVEKTQNPLTSEYQDNRACARKNQPLLESALRALEARVGKPIVESGSRYYLDQVFTYGFRNSNQVMI